MIGSRVYTFACTLEELEAQGVNIVSEEYTEGYWHSANNGRAAFEVLLTGTLGDPTELSVAGVKFVPDGAQVFTLPGGIIVGKHTRSDVIAAYGEPHVNNSANDWFSFNRGKIEFRVHYTNEGVVKEFQMISHAPLSWGFEFDGQAGVAQEDLPEPAEMNFDEYILDGKLYQGRITLKDLEKHGWVIDHAEDLSVEIEPQDGKIPAGNPILVCYNGRSTLQVLPVNRSAESGCALGECGVMYIGVNESDGVSLMLADGLTTGCSYDDVLSVFGEAAKVVEHEEEGYIYYEHKVMGSVTYGFSVYDGVVRYIRVQP